MIRSTVGLRRAGALAAVCGLLLACDDAVVAATGDARLVLDVRVAPAAAAAAVDQYRLRIDGPTDRTVTVAPGTIRTVEGLAPGSYSVSLEGLTGGEVETFGETTGVRVVAGENTTASVVVNNFVPGVPTGPTEAVGSAAPGRWRSHCWRAARLRLRRPRRPPGASR